MIKAEAKVGTNAQKSGNRLYSLMIQTVIKIASVPETDKALLIFLF